MSIMIGDLEVTYDKCKIMQFTDESYDTSTHMEDIDICRNKGDSYFGLQCSYFEAYAIHSNCRTVVKHELFIKHLLKTPHPPRRWSPYFKPIQDRSGLGITGLEHVKDKYNIHFGQYIYGVHTIIPVCITKAKCGRECD
jgi:hypothetical protein